MMRNTYLFFLTLLSSKILLASTLPEWKDVSLNDYLKNSSKSYEIKSISSDGLKGEPNFFLLSELLPNGNRRLVMHLFDFDRDKNIDLAKHFENDKLVRSEWSLDKDDKVDAVKYYDPVSGELKMKIENESNKLVWSHYFKGELRQKEMDRNADSKPDIWYHYKSDKLIKVEAAKNFDPKKVEDITSSIVK